jgi:hypothetical protein
MARASATMVANSRSGSSPARQKQFQRHFPLQHRVPGAVDFTKTSAAQTLQQLKSFPTTSTAGGIGLRG